MKRKIIFLLNPIAGRGNRSGIKRLIEARMPAMQTAFLLLSTNAEGKYDDVREKILHEGFTDVIVAGGDGTISSVVNDLRDTGVNFGLIPCGSGNGLALSAGISKKANKAFDNIFSGEPVLTDAFIINQHFSCMLSGLGFDAQVAHDFAKQKKRGFITYAKQTYSNFLKAKPYTFTINADGRKVNTEAFFISIANSNQFGNQFTIAPQASLTDGLLDIVAVQKMSKLQMLFSLLHQITNGKVKERLYTKNKVIYYQTAKLVIDNHDAAPLHVDGDPKDTASSFNISIIPNAFRLIRPSKAAAQAK
ncbi:MAG: diacylglycerol kinase [Chitinophagaceae bacterium]|nr:diacylglycerol kinase [Chitinophagaceae bacterium]